MQILFGFFLPTMLIGAFLFLIVWLPTRRLKPHGRFWRFLLSGITAFAFAPTSMEFCGRYDIAPASFASLMILAPDPLRRSVGFVSGVLPLLAVSLAIFFVWSYYAERKCQAAAPEPKVI